MGIGKNGMGQTLTCNRNLKGKLVFLKNTVINQYNSNKEIYKKKDEITYNWFEKNPKCFWHPPPRIKKNQNQLLLGHLIGPWCEKRTSIRQTRPQNL